MMTTMRMFFLCIVFVVIIVVVVAHSVATESVIAVVREDCNRQSG